MLYLVKGRAGSGKTDFVNQKIKSILDNNSSNVLLIVPEQFSFESERKMLKLLGEEKYNKIDIFSFPRLAFSTLKESFDFSGVPSSGVRLALMHEAISALQGRLNIFGKSKATVNSLSPLVEFSRELKYCSVKSEDLLEKINLLSNEFLKEKLTEINLINEAYDALVKRSYFDDTEALDVMNTYATDNCYFKNKTVFIDGFRAFTKQESNLFRTMLLQADDVYVTLCADSAYHKNSSFTYIKNFEDKLSVIANDCKINVIREFLEQNYESFSQDILSLERGLFNSKKDVPTTTDNSVTIVNCFNSDDECDFISKEIKRLLRSKKYRCRDIAIIERVAGTYKSRIVDRLRKLDVPVFDDSRRSLKYEPLFVYINSILKCISSSFTQESVFSYLKSGLSGVSIEDISRLEKYALIWNISGSKWADDFTMHPKGFGNEFKESDAKRLEILNESRKNAIVPLLKLKKDCKDKTGLEISSLIYDFLVSQHISDRLFDLYSKLNDDGFSVESNRQSVSWDMLMSLLGTMSKIYHDKIVSLPEWVEKFNLLVDSGDVGEIPQGLDEVKIGSADRIRTDKLKVVFLVGVNKGEFPLVNVKGGVLTDYDRVSLSSVGLEINPPFEKNIDEERFISYCAVTAASEKLYLVYKNVTDDGVSISESEIVTEAKMCIDNINIIDADNLSVIDEIESDDDAFYTLAKNFSTENTIKSTLVKYFEDKPEYADKINALNKAVDKKGFSFADSTVSTELFGVDMEVSPSSIETFYKCPFSYFMKYGLLARDIELAEIDPRISGSVVHYVLENLIKEYFAPEIKVDADGREYEEISSNKFVDSTDAEILNCIRKYLKKYLAEMMGNISEQSKRFMYLYNRVVDVCKAVIDRLKAEFNNNGFKPHDFELEIKVNKKETNFDTASENDEEAGDDSKKKNTIPAYELPLVNGKISVKGKIDRVDVYDNEGIRYIRVIDYKTGNKDFKLSELFSGYNLQMVLYLIALMKNGGEYYNSDKMLPAAVLYIPSKIGLNDYLSKRHPEDEEIKNNKIKAGKLNGMVLKKTAVYDAMKVKDNPSYFPVKYDSKSNLVGNNYTMKQFDNLSKMIDGKIIDMGNILHSGEIAAKPLANDKGPLACKYCEYRNACGYEDGDEVVELYSAKHSDVLIDKLGGEDDGMD